MMKTKENTNKIVVKEPPFPHEDSWAGIALGAVSLMGFFVALNLIFSCFGH